MTNTTTIDVTDQAPYARVVGKMWPCPEWCTHDALSSLPPSRELEKTQTALFRITHSCALQVDGDVGVGLSQDDVVQGDGQVIRDLFVEIYVGDEVMTAPGASDLCDALNKAVAIADGDTKRQLLERGLATKDQLT
jgi:hypothetical protein